MGAEITKKHIRVTKVDESGMKYETQFYFNPIFRGNREARITSYSQHLHEEEKRDGPWELSVEWSSDRKSSREVHEDEATVLKIHRELEKWVCGLYLSEQTIPEDFPRF